MPKIIIQKGRVVFQNAEFEAPVVNIGRAREMDVIFFDTTVSRHHARILAENGKFYLEDMGSRFGTLLDGKRMLREKRYRLKNDAQVKLGSSEFNIQIGTEERKPVFSIQRSGEDSVLESGFLLRDRTGYKLSTATQDIFAGVGNPDQLGQKMLDALIAMVNLEEGGILLKDSAGASRFSVYIKTDRKNTTGNRQRIEEKMKRTLKKGFDDLPHVAERDNLPSEMNVPITSGDSVCGLIYGKADSGGFSEEDVGFLLHFQRIVSVADENAKRIEEVRRASEIEKARADELQTEVLRFYSSQKLIGSGKTYRTIVEAIEDFKNINKEVLITGESGTGKDVVARTLHYSGPRKDGPFVAIHLGALPKELILSEIFGHEKGAFTGATDRKIGKFELARGGTLFLDEIGEIPHESQVMLLRVLENREFQRIGSNRVIRADFRLICATNRDLEEAVLQKEFRKDLFYRINFLKIHLPPLRERKEDIPVLTAHFLDELAREMQIRKKEISPEALNTLRVHDYPGNIRELKNILGRATILAKGDRIELRDLPPEFHGWEKKTAGASGTIPRNMDELKELEKAMIMQAIEERGWNLKAAALQIGLSRQALYQKLKAYGIKRNSPPKRSV